MIKYLVFDPSGNFNEGQGTTGWALFNNSVLVAVGQIRAEDYCNNYFYQKAHIDLIDILKPTKIIIEDYYLYAHKAKNQINSRMETPKLIGILEYHCNEKNIPVVFQRATDVKTRWNDKILVHKQIITKSEGGRYYAVGVQLSKHMRDAIRHGIHYITFKKEEM